MLTLVVPPTNRVTTTHGLKIGQKVRLKMGGKEGTIVAFGPGWPGTNSATVKICLNDGTGNMGDHHSCGIQWVEAV